MESSRYTKYNKEIFTELSSSDPEKLKLTIKICRSYENYRKL